MALPKAIGDNPEIVTITKDVWTFIATGVNIAKISNNFGANQVVWMTYLKVGDAAPSGLMVPKWKVTSDSLQFIDNVTIRDIYLYAVAKDAEITIES